MKLTTLFTIILMTIATCRTEGIVGSQTRPDAPRRLFLRLEMKDGSVYSGFSFSAESESLYIIANLLQQNPDQLRVDASHSYGAIIRNVSLDVEQAITLIMEAIENKSTEAEIENELSRNDFFFKHGYKPWLQAYQRALANNQITAIAHKCNCVIRTYEKLQEAENREVKRIMEIVHAKQQGRSPSALNNLDLDAENFSRDGYAKWYETYMQQIYPLEIDPAANNVVVSFSKKFFAFYRDNKIDLDGIISRLKKDHENWSSIKITVKKDFVINIAQYLFLTICLTINSSDVSKQARFSGLTLNYVADIPEELMRTYYPSAYKLYQGAPSAPIHVAQIQELAKGAAPVAPAHPVQVIPAPAAPQPSIFNKLKRLYYNHYVRWIGGTVIAVGAIYSSYRLGRYINAQRLAKIAKLISIKA